MANNVIYLLRAVSISVRSIRDSKPLRLCIHNLLEPKDSQMSTTTTVKTSNREQE